MTKKTTHTLYQEAIAAAKSDLNCRGIVDPILKQFDSHEAMYAEIEEYRRVFAEAFHRHLKSLSATSDPKSEETLPTKKWAQPYYD